MRSPGISGKELNVISYLELEGKRFFTRSDINQFFKNKNEMNVYIHKLKIKGRIIKLNKEKYYLVPIKAYQSHWSEHPFIIIDEIFNGQNYFIGGKAAAYYWKHIDQIPTTMDVYTTKKQGERKILDCAIRYRRISKKNMHGFLKKTVKGHIFFIANKKRSLSWK